MRSLDPRRFLLALLLAAVAAGAGAAPAAAAISQVQKSPATYNGGGTLTITLPSASQSGSLLVATVGAEGSTTLTAPAGWVRAAQNTASGSDTNEIWYYPNNPGGITSVTFGSGGTSMTGGTSEWRGVAAASPLDRTGTNAVGNSSTLTVATSAATTTSGQLAVTSFAHKTSSAQPVSFTPGSGWTNIGNSGARSLKVHGTADYKTGLAAGTISEQQTVSISGGMTGVIATFKAATCSGGSLTASAPATIGFPAVTLDGTNRQATTTIALGVSDLSGTGAGWRVTGTSNTFTNGSGKTLPTTATTITAASATPGGGSCSTPTNSVSYPVTLPAGASPPAAVSLYNAAAGTGEGESEVSLAGRLDVPANAYTGTYTSTWTITAVSGP